MHVIQLAALRASLSRRIGRGFHIAACTVAFAGMSVTAQPAGRKVDFDIPAQSLEAALDAYGAASRLHVLYESDLTVGLQSTAVRGPFTAEEALRRLLAGTGLAVRYTGPRSYTLLPMSRNASPARPPATAAAGAPSSRPAEVLDFRHFLGGVQAGITERLCGDPLTRPGRYRVALQFWINAAGIVQSPVLLESSGDKARDRAIAAALNHLAFSEAPPTAMPQPVTMVVAPPPATTDQVCPTDTP